jgi:hypothetical protein
MTTLDDTCRCHCGLHLFDARTGTPAYARHIAHVEAFRAEVQRQIDQALAEWGLPSATTGRAPAAWPGAARNANSAMPPL